MYKKLVLLLFLLSAFMLGFLPVKDTDFGWHYRCGNDFLTTGLLCTKNRFSYFLTNYKAYNPSFIYDITLAFVYNHFGFVGISFLGGIIFGLTAYCLIKLLKGFYWLKMAVFYAVFFLSSSTLTLGLRSQILTVLFLTISLALVQNYSKLLTRVSKSEKLSWKYYAKFLLYPLLMFIWVNTHIGFFLGLVILLFLFSEHRIFLVGAVLIASFLATMANPFGIQVYREVVNHAFSPLDTMIAEWVPPIFWQKVIIVLVAITLFVLLVGQKRMSLSQIFLLIFFTLLGLKARRNLPIFYIVAAYIFIKLAGEKFLNTLSARIISITGENISSLSLMLPFTVIIFSIAGVVNTIKFDRSWNSYCTQGLSHYPCLALQENPQLGGNIFAAYEWGGFLIWQLPTAKIFVDGRMSAWRDENGQSPYQVYLYIIQAQESWNKKLRQWHTDYLLIAPNTFLDLLLQEKAAKFGWQEQYRDKIAVVYKNNL